MVNWKVHLPCRGQTAFTQGQKTADTQEYRPGFALFYAFLLKAINSNFLMKYSGI